VLYFTQDLLLVLITNKEARYDSADFPTTGVACKPPGDLGLI
jgi:hypothetical protein